MSNIRAVPALCTVLACTLVACSGASDKEDLAVRNGPVSIAGTLYLPEAGGRVPAVVIIHGSGPDTRDEYRDDADYTIEV